MGSDIDKIRSETSLANLCKRFGVALAVDGNEHIGLCPFHAESTPSFTVFSGKDRVERFHCFGCGERGDAIDFVARIKGVATREAIEILGGREAGPNVAPRVVETVDPYAGITRLDPPEEITLDKAVRLFNPKRAADPDRVWGVFKPTLLHAYRRSDGSLIGYVMRRTMRDGGKETPMVQWVRLPTGRECWSRFPFEKPRPLYGLETLRPDTRQVIIVEGEKCADRLSAATRRVALSWAGGTYGVEHADWSPMAGRNVVIWPDADKPGLATAHRIAAAVLRAGATSARILDVADGEGAARLYSPAEAAEGAIPPVGWDCADAVEAGWSRADLDGFMRARVSAPVSTNEAQAETPAPREEAPRVSPAANPPPPRQPPPSASDTPSDEPRASARIIPIATARARGFDWRDGLVTNEEGKTKPNVTKNWGLFLENHPNMKGVLAFDSFRRRTAMIKRPPWDDDGASWQARPITDRDLNEAVMWLESHHMTPKASNIAAVVETVAARSAFDPLSDYLDGLKWDRKPRVATWLAYFLGVEHSDYAQTIGRCWLVSAVARALSPGCKVDTMPILEGPQGKNKSSAIRVLFGDEFFTDSLSDIATKDAAMEVQGVWGMEIAEMHRFSQAETNQVKKFLARQIDRYRPPYGRHVIEAPRRVVMNGTINPEGNPYLRDPTGARRFWPIVCGAIDLDAIAKDRDQLWAEAVALYKAGAQWWVPDDAREAVEAEQEKRTDVDVWTDAIAPHVALLKSVTQVSIFDALGVRMKDADWRHSARVGRIMKTLGWDVKRDRANGEDRVMFVRPEAGRTDAPASQSDLSDGW